MTYGSPDVRFAADAPGNLVGQGFLPGYLAVALLSLNLASVRLPPREFENLVEFFTGNGFAARELRAATDEATRRQAVSCASVRLFPTR